MSTRKPQVTVTFNFADARAAVEAGLAEHARLVFVDEDTKDADRRQALIEADALLVGVLPAEVPYELWPEMNRCKFVQCCGTGIDYIDRNKLPDELLFANNPGVSAVPIAEQTLGMAISLIRKIPQNHQRMREGHWDQFVPLPTLRGMRCAIIGFGGIGQEMARLLRFMGARILAINTSGKTDQAVDFVGTLADLEACLGQADMAIVTLPLTDGTIGIIGARELAWLKPDGYIINISRGEVIDETALYEHLVAHPEFSAGIDAWWVEPLRHGRFEMKHPFLDLPNVIASPHNSAVAPDSMANTCRVAVENVQRYLTGGTVRGIAREIDWLTQNT